MIQALAGFGDVGIQAATALLNPRAVGFPHDRSRVYFAGLHAQRYKELTSRSVNNSQLDLYEPMCEKLEETLCLDLTFADFLLDPADKLLDKMWNDLSTCVHWAIAHIVFRSLSPRAGENLW